MNDYPKRLIEVDLPIKRISAHARREKSIRHGHISTLHIWWARRPLAACRAVICASLWPDPADPLCPQSFRDIAAETITAFAHKAATNERLSESCSKESLGRWLALDKPQGKLDPTNPAHLNMLRYALLDFIADFANWDNSTVPDYLDASRALTQAAHEALGGAPGTRPLVVDPFAGGGAIPLEALRVGADAFASDLNPVAVLLNKVVLEYIPKYGQRLADEVRKWGEWIKEQAEKELAEFYPKDPDGATPIAYLWARTITCEGPGCGAEVPLMRSLWLCKKQKRLSAIHLIADTKHKRVRFEITHNTKNIGDGTVKRGSATCPVCGYTTSVVSVREQLKKQQGGARKATLFCVVTTKPGEQRRFYRTATEHDTNVYHRAVKELDHRIEILGKNGLSLIPNEPLPLMSGVFNVPIYGHNTWGSLFNPRQALALSVFAQFVEQLASNDKVPLPKEFAIAVQTCLALAVDRLADRMSCLCSWRPQADQEKIEHVFTWQALPMTWDFAEGTPLTEGTAGWDDAYEPPAQLIEKLGITKVGDGTALSASATANPLTDDSADLLVTDPPYYNAVPYADLSDFFYVWLRRSLIQAQPELLAGKLSPKDEEICEMAGWDSYRYPHKTKSFFEHEMGRAMAESRRVLRPQGIGVVVFAHKSTAGWEAQIEAMIHAGWVISGSWPIDTEMGTRLRARNSAALASSIHLVCRPRENPDGSVTSESIGDWRDVLTELPMRINEWMPRLAAEGVVGADAIFACLGPALEVFSRYSHVEKASGEQVTLREYLEQVWAAVSREALTLIFSGGDVTGFEEDARMTAMWLWTLSTNLDADTDANASEDEEPAADDDEGASAKALKSGGFMLEYDAARKIAQGLGAHLEQLKTLIEVKGDKARLLPVRERMTYLLGGVANVPAATSRKAKKVAQPRLFEGGATTNDEVAQAEWGALDVPEPGSTILDRIHQSMLLFNSGQGDALKRFLVENGAGSDQRFWKLAQALSALYPAGTDEKRWVDGTAITKSIDRD